MIPILVYTSLPAAEVADEDPGLAERRPPPQAGRRRTRSSPQIQKLLARRRPQPRSSGLGACNLSRRMNTAIADQSRPQPQRIGELYGRGRSEGAHGVRVSCPAFRRALHPSPCRSTRSTRGVFGRPRRPRQRTSPGFLAELIAEFADSVPAAHARRSGMRSCTGDAEGLELRGPLHPRAAAGSSGPAAWRR